MAARSRFPERKKREDGTWGCRGCGGDIPKGRQSWCSKDCLDRHWPARVNAQAYKRDGGKCVLCGWDFEFAEAAAQKNSRAQYQADLERRGYSRLNWKYDHLNRKPEFDHIIPFSEGGPTVLENMRTLCRPCHRGVTAEWRRKKAAERLALKKGTPNA